VTDSADVFWPHFPARGGPTPDRRGFGRGDSAPPTSVPRRCLKAGHPVWVGARSRWNHAPTRSRIGAETRPVGGAGNAGEIRCL
jgi:hypothetical protein